MGEEVRRTTEEDVLRMRDAADAVYALAGKLTNWDAGEAITVLASCVWKLYTSDGVPTHARRYVREVLADLLSEMSAS